MPKEKKAFCVVCIANYCRSPVLEALLKKRFKNYEFYSAGISPIYEATMDPRSLNYLKIHDINNIIHTPKKISRKMLDYFDVFLAIDFFVLAELNRLYPKYRNKFKLVTSDFKNIDIIDPFRMDDTGYNEIMDRIFHVSKNINL